MSNRSERLRHLHALTGGVAATARRTSLRAETTTEADEQGVESTSAELWLYGVVGGWWSGFDSTSVARALQGLDVDRITVRLHSPGGDAIEGIAIGNLFRNHKAAVTVVVDGMAASAASVIAIAGDEVVMSPGSQFMLHDPWMFTIGNAAELREDADFLDGQGANYAEVYATRGGKSADEWRQIMLAETWLTAQASVDAGLADRVGTVPAATARPMPEPELDEDDDFEAREQWDLDALVHPAARAVWRGRAVHRNTPKPPTASAGGSSTTKEELVDFTPEQIAAMRAQIGFPEDADAATITAAVTEALEERADDKPAPTAATTPPAGMVLVEEGVWSATRDQAAQGAAARAQQLEERRDRAISAAVADGRITPARRDHWAAAWTADPEGAEQTLATLQPGLVPVAEVGHSDSVSTDAQHIDAEVAAFASALGLKGAF